MAKDKKEMDKNFAQIFFPNLPWYLFFFSRKIIPLFKSETKSL